MILLALDTCEARGSLAVLRDGEVLQALPHEGTGDYSSWVLPTAEKALSASRVGIRDVEVFAVASGPGSFTGVRIGLTSVKAWSEAYGKPVASVSRLEAMASQVLSVGAYVAAFADAHRDQVFGGLYRRDGSGLRLVETEIVAAPQEFVDWVSQRSANERVNWISLDPEKVTGQQQWRVRAERGETVELSTSMLAPAIGRIGRMRALEGRLTDSLGLDAEYVRRPDAEVFWKGKAKRGVEGPPQRGVSRVRSFRAEDAEAVAAIVEESPEAAHWSKESYVEFAHEDAALALVSETDGEITGFLIGRRVSDQAELLNLAVTANRRRKGDGTALLAAAVARFQLRAVKSLYLEVRESNTRAITFYEKHGFAKTGRRNGYYRNPDEPAITMEKKLIG